MQETPPAASSPPAPQPQEAKRWTSALAVAYGYAEQGVPQDLKGMMDANGVYGWVVMSCHVFDDIHLSLVSGLCMCMYV